MRPIALALLVAACTTESTYTAAFYDFTDARAGTSPDARTEADTASIVEVEVEDAAADALEVPDTASGDVPDVPPLPPGCLYPEGPCPDAWRCIVDETHPLGGFCGCDCPGSPDPYRCGPDGQCVLATAPYEDNYVVASFGDGLYGFYDDVETGQHPALGFNVVLPGRFWLRDEAAAACAKLKLGGRDWYWELPPVAGYSRLAMSKCPDMEWCVGSGLLLEEEKEKCPVHANCWPFESEGEESFWTADAYNFGFQPSGLVAPAPTMSLKYPAICAGRYDPDPPPGYPD